MATQLDKGHHKVTNDLLRLIKWENKSGGMNTLRLYALLASVWEKVSDLMNLDISTTTTIATKYNGDPEKCIRDVIGRWMNDQEKLSANYKCTWNGICRLLKDLQLSSASSQLKEALAADVSSFNANTQRQELPATILDHRDKTLQDFITPFAPKQHEELETMTEDERAQLVDTLQIESHDMMTNFADILINFDDFLIQQSTRIDSVAHMKRILFKYLDIPPLRQEEKSYSLISKLSNATTIDDISIILGKYCSFFNYKLLENIFTHMRYDEGHDALRRHEEDLIEYAKRRIYYFPSGLGIRGFSHAVIAVKLDDMYEGTRRVHLLTFHRKLCELLRLTLGQCLLDGLKPGCIRVTLHILDHLVKDTFPLNTDQQAALQSLTCNGSKIRSLTCEPFSYVLAYDQSTTTETELKEAMEQKCGLQESRVEEKKHNIKETQSKEIIQPDKMEIIITKTQKLLEYTKQETRIEGTINLYLQVLYRELRELYGHKGSKTQHYNVIEHFISWELIPHMRKQTALAQELLEWFHKMKMPTSALTTLRSDSDMLDMEKMLRSNRSVENCLLVLQNIIKSQEKYYEVKKRFIDEYYDKVKRHKEHSSEISNEQVNIRELQSEIDRNNREVENNTLLWEKLKLILEFTPEFSSETSTPTKHSTLPSASEEPMSELRPKFSMKLREEPMLSSYSIPPLKIPPAQTNIPKSSMKLSKEAVPFSFFKPRQKKPHKQKQKLSRSLLHDLEENF